MARRLSASSKNENAAAETLSSKSLARKDAQASAPKVGDRIPVVIEGLEGPLGAVEIGALDTSKPLRSEGWLIEESKDSSAHFVLVPLKSGKRKVPELLVRKKSAQDQVGESLFKIEPFEIEIASELQGSSQPPPEALPPVTLQFPWRPVAFWGVIGVLLLVVLIWIARKIFGKKVPRTVPIPVPTFVRPPEDQEAFERLNRIEREDYARRGEFKKHYFSISEVLKDYLGRRYGFDALESTTHELIQALERSGVSLETIRETRVLFDRLDLVKFTDFTPQVNESTEVLEGARKLVSTTRKMTTPMVGKQEGPRAF